MTEKHPIKELFDLTGRVALVTGATGYLGSAMAEALAEAGCQVIVASRKSESAQASASQLPSVNGASHAGVALDHMDEASIERGFQAAVKIAGKIDILIDNGHEPTAANWRNTTGDQFNRQLQNATGYFLLARMLRDHAVARNGSGSIIMLGSMYGLVGSYPEVYEGVGSPSPAAYQVLKGGIIQLTRHLAVYWAKDRVRVNCLSPGPFPSPAAPAEVVNRLKTKSPMERMGQPWELKGAALFLASDASSYVTGHNLVVDGGWTAW
jgi:NAD(P)-dependent dehydrogenase (short-subunit alcohol dehydrogenase family)